MQFKKSFMALAAATFILLGTSSIFSEAVAADKVYGCYLVIDAHSINIRKRAWSKSAVLTTANRGQVLKKWKRFCSLRGYWCPVQKGSIKGHASKAHLLKVDCP